jgi:hypothetical protein
MCTLFLPIKPCNGRRPDSIRGNRSAYVFWVLVEYLYLWRISRWIYEIYMWSFLKFHVI